MWILSFLPIWGVHAILIIGIGMLLVGLSMGTRLGNTSLVPLPLCLIGSVLFAAGLFLEGSRYNEEVWQSRVKEVEAKLVIAEEKSKVTNTKIVEKIVTKTQVVTTRGEDIIKYVDKEVVKYDTKFAPGGECEIPKEFIKAINDAAEEPK
jgi:hypothetical protein